MRLVPLKRLCTTITRGSVPTYSDDDAGTALAIGQSCQRPDGTFDPERGRWHAGGVPEKGRLCDGDVLINSTGTGTLGRVALVTGLPTETECFVDTHVTLLRFDRDHADSRFMAYSLGLPNSRTFIEDGLSVGATKQRELNVEALRAHRVVAPELREQREIADVLDRECARIDALSGELRRLQLALEHDAADWVSRAIHGMPTVRLRYRLNGIDQGWSPQCDERPAEGGEWGVLKVGCVNYGRFRASENKRLPDDLEPRPEAKVRPGDVLMSRANTRELAGSAALVTELGNSQLMLSDKLYRLRFGKDLLPQFAALVLNSRSVRDQIEISTSGASSSMQNISQDLVRSLLIPDCPPSHQRRIIEEHAARQAGLSATAEEIQLTSNTLTEYRDALITEAVAGKFSVTA